ncbi:proton-coupled folate transporter-like [Cydia strobilella]|uniref:proton-coupled folate transporter-like n=1 Tax=Cydia strobilella TaxID=1100964 RepID=UPI0030053DAC
MAEEKNKSTEKLEDDPLREPQNEQFKDKTFQEKLAYIKDNITVEPMLAGLIIPSVISRFAMGNFNLDKACRVNKGFGDEICDALVKKTSNNYTFYEQEVQKLISSIDIWRGLVQTAIPCMIIIFLGAWSDRTGKRKICILLPILGEILTSISNLINVYFFYEIPVEITVLMETIFPAFTGSWVTMFLGVFSYISDITSVETRTFRVGLVNFCMTAGLPLGIGISGYLLKNMGYYGIFSVTLVAFIVILAYGCFCLKEPEEWLRDKGLPVIEREKQENVSFFDVTHVSDTVVVAYRQREGNGRTKVLLTLFCVFILYGPSMSEHSVFYLYLRNQLNWDMVKYGVFTSYSIVLHSIGAMFTITVLSRKLQVEDSLLCTISITSKFVGSIWIAFVTTDIEMYLVPVVEFFNASTFTSLRSIISKLVEKDETAKVNSLFSLTETVAALVFHPLYTWIYMRTLNVFPGTVFIMSAAFIIPAVIVLLMFYVKIKMESKSARKIAFESQEKRDAEEKKTEPLDFLRPNIEPIENAEVIK